MKQVQSAGIITWHIIDNVIHYLLLQYGAGHWEFPKGKVEPHETLQQAAHRELHEETGLYAQIDPDFSAEFSYIFTDRDGTRIQKQAIFFLGHSKDTDVILSAEHKNFGWYIFNNAYEKVTFANARHVLKQADEWLMKNMNARSYMDPK